MKEKAWQVRGVIEGHAGGWTGQERCKRGSVRQVVWLCWRLVWLEGQLETPNDARAAPEALMREGLLPVALQQPREHRKQQLPAVAASPG